MASFAEIDSNNIVVRVVRTDDNDPNGDYGHQWLVDNLGGRWVQTSFSASFRKNFAGEGYSYDEQRDAFIAPKPYPSWVLNEETCKWEAPTPIPGAEDSYFWNEEQLAWNEVAI